MTPPLHTTTHTLSLIVVSHIMLTPVQDFDEYGGYMSDSQVPPLPTHPPTHYQTHTLTTTYTPCAPLTLSPNQSHINLYPTIFTYGALQDFDKYGGYMSDSPVSFPPFLPTHHHHTHTQ